MDRNDGSFDSDRKWCPACDAYVPYLMSIATSYCAHCGGEVRLLSREDWEAFSAKMEARKPKGGRRRRGSRSDTSAPRRDSA